jgi:hypothetical protein
MALRRSRSVEAAGSPGARGRRGAAASRVVLVCALGTALAPAAVEAAPPSTSGADRAPNEDTARATGGTDAQAPAADGPPSATPAPSPLASAEPANPTEGTDIDVDAGAEGTSGEPVDAEVTSDAQTPARDEAPARSEAEVPRPPRIDGAFVGGTLGVGMTFTRVNDLSTPSPMIGPVGIVSAGDAVFPWLTIGISFFGGGGFTGDQRVSHGGLLLDVGLLPAPKRAPFSFRLGAGFGAGAVRDANETARFGFGGALFRGGVRYEFFPTAAKRRPNRGGGWSIGPELTWLGETPAAAGRPMANTILLGLWTGFYFGS